MIRGGVTNLNEETTTVFLNIECQPTKSMTNETSPNEFVRVYTLIKVTLEEMLITSDGLATIGSVISTNNEVCTELVVKNSSFQHLKLDKNLFEGNFHFIDILQSRYDNLTNGTAN